MNNKNFDLSLHFLEATGLAQTFRNIGEEIGLDDTSELINEAARLSCRHFTEEEMEVVIGFYTCPEGQAFQRKYHALTDDFDKLISAMSFTLQARLLLQELNSPVEVVYNDEVN